MDVWIDVLCQSLKNVIKHFRASDSVFTTSSFNTSVEFLLNETSEKRCLLLSKGPEVSTCFENFLQNTQLQATSIKSALRLPRLQLLYLTVSRLMFAVT